MSIAVAAIARLGTSSLSQLSVLHNRNSWLLVVPSCHYAKSAEQVLGLDKPKRPVTPFLKFALQLRPALKSKNPDSETTQLMKLAAKHWEQVTADVKTKLSKEYESNLEQYRKQMAKYEESLTNEQKAELIRVKQELADKKEKRKAKAQWKELGRPKRPPSSYMLFCQTEVQNMSKLGFKEFQNVMKEKWNSITPAEKTKWEAKASALMAQYQKELAAWEEKMVAEGHIDIVRTRKVPAIQPTDKNKANK